MLQQRQNEKPGFERNTETQNCKGGNWSLTTSGDSWTTSGCWSASFWTASAANDTFLVGDDSFFLTAVVTDVGGGIVDSFSVANVTVLFWRRFCNSNNRRSSSRMAASTSLCFLLISSNFLSRSCSSWLPGATTTGRRTTAAWPPRSWSKMRTTNEQLLN